MTGILMKIGRGRFETEEKGKTYKKKATLRQRQRLERCCQSRGTPGPPEVGGGGEGSFPRARRGGMVLPTLISDF